jgi:glycosyltransferase involved in cell wall biosynthesis
MKLALYHPWIYLHSGIERMIAELVGRSSHEWILYTHHYEPESTYPAIASLDVRELEPGVSVRRSVGPIGRAALTIARTELPDDGARALLVSSEGLGDLIVLRNRLPAVAYCHTPLKIVHDPATNARLATMSPRKHAATRVIGPVFTSADRLLWKRYRHVFVNSEEVRCRVGAAGLTPSGSVEVLHPGVDTEPRPFTAGRPRTRFLAAGRIMWQKNLELAIDAVRVVHDRGHDVELHIAGAVDVKSRPYLRALRERAADLPVQFHVDVDDAVLVEQISTARALLFTAPNEDFGMVLLEAMSCGTPPIAVDRGGPREIVTDGAGWLVRPDAEAFADAMVESMNERGYGERQAAARSRAELFAWGRFVRRIDEVMPAIAEGRSATSTTPA